MKHNSFDEEQPKPMEDDVVRQRDRALEPEDDFILPTPQPAKNSRYSGKQGLLVGLGLGFALALIGGRIILPGQASKTQPAPAATSQAPAQSVTVTEVESASVNRTLEATGTVTAFEMISVTAEANSLQIEQVLVDEGDFVQGGQTLVRLDNAILQAQLTQAQASVAQAEARVAELRSGSRSEEIARARESVRSAEAGVKQAQSDSDLAQQRVTRNRMLQAEGAISRDRLDEILNVERNSQATLDQAKARLQEAKQQLAELQAGPRPEAIDQAEAQLAQAKGQVQLISAQLDQTVVVAPRSGKIAKRNAKVGDVTSSSDTLFEIVQNGRLELKLKVPETQLPQIRPGQTVEITSDTDSTLRTTGTIREIEPVVDAESRQATVNVDLPDSSGLKPGMFLRASIVTSATPGLLLPADAVLPQADGRSIVYIVQGDDTVKAQTVETGKILSDGRVEIKSGLNSGDRIVVKGAPYLKGGDRIAIQN